MESEYDSIMCEKKIDASAELNIYFLYYFSQIRIFLLQLGYNPLVPIDNIDNLLVKYEKDPELEDMIQQLTHQ